MTARVLTEMIAFEVLARKLGVTQLQGWLFEDGAVADNDLSANAVPVVDQDWYDCEYVEPGEPTSTLNRLCC